MRKMSGKTNSMRKPLAAKTHVDTCDTDVSSHHYTTINRFVALPIIPPLSKLLKSSVEPQDQRLTSTHLPNHVSYLD